MRVSGWKYQHEVDGVFLGLCLVCGEPVYDVEELGGVIYADEVESFERQVWTGRSLPQHGVCYDIEGVDMVERSTSR